MSRRGGREAGRGGGPVPALMLQGTASHVGKTVLVAGLCRALREAGYDVAPFKAQNMALNAFVTAEGGEIGWAQAMQAEAAGVEPSVDMNPILLKPEAGRCQVVVHGRVRATLDAAGYYARRAEWWAAVEASYQRLRRRHQVLVIEGAGSPAEPNLLQHDLVNMAVARLARAPVVLVGDIDRGGVFAAFLGTLALLPAADRRRVRGFLVNRFRGDAALLGPGLAFLAGRTRRPVLGVVPYLDDLTLPEEDSVALEGAAARPRADLGAGLGRPDVTPTSPGGMAAAGLRRVRAVVVRLPHVANFTDFAPLESEPGVELAYARRPEDLAGADLVLLPGSKATLADLRWLRATGLEAALRAHVRRGGRLAGICGGYQMLGARIADPAGLEGGGTAEGLGLLPVMTTLEVPKVTRRVRARLPAAPGLAFDAYEIHLGRTLRPETLAPFAWVETPEGAHEDGAVGAGGRVWGTYLHGLFDQAAVRRMLLGGPPEGPPGEDHRAMRERQYARLAKVLAEHADLPALWRLAGLS